MSPAGPTHCRSGSRYRRQAAALVSAVAILIVVAAFAALFLSVHSTQISTAELAVRRLRAEAGALAATHLTLWKFSQDTDQQHAVARVVYEHDTSFATTPLFQVDGNLAGATFHVDLWPGADTVRLKTVAQCGGVYFQRWAQMPIQLEPALELVLGGDFEDPARIGSAAAWQGAASVGQWLASSGITSVDDPRHQAGSGTWNITRAAPQHFAEELRSTALMAQYMAGQGAQGSLTLAFDYIRKNGSFSVQVRGVATLPAAGSIAPGQPVYDAWANAGTLLYDSGNLSQCTSWTHVAATIDSGPGYAYYVVQVNAQGGGGTPATPERAVDNVSLKGNP